MQPELRSRGGRAGHRGEPHREPHADEHRPLARGEIRDVEPQQRSTHSAARVPTHVDARRRAVVRVRPAAHQRGVRHRRPDQGDERLGARRGRLRVVRAHGHEQATPASSHEQGQPERVHVHVRGCVASTANSNGPRHARTSATRVRSAVEHVEHVELGELGSASVSLRRSCVGVCASAQTLRVEKTSTSTPGDACTKAGCSPRCSMPAARQSVSSNESRFASTIGYGTWCTVPSWSSPSRST